MYTETAVDSGYKTLPLNMLEESTTNPRRTFEPTKLVELAASLTAHGLIQPITVRPRGELFEIVAGARRFRAAQIAELAEVPVRILELSDEQTLEVQIIENSQRQDVHPYEEASAYQRLLDLPGYSVDTLVQKTGRSQSHIYARLTLLELIPEVATAFQEERITASHANLIARLPSHRQADAFAECWRKDYRDPDAYLLPAKNVAAWIQANLYLPLHDPRQSQERAERPVPVLTRPTEDETEEQTAARKADYERRQAEFKADQERRETARQAEEDRCEKEAEAQRERIEKLRTKREKTFQRLSENAPAVFSGPQLRALLRALVNLDPYSFADDLAVEVNGDDENDQRSADEVLMTAIEGLTDDKLTGFAVRLALSGHRGIPRDGETDFLTEADAVLSPRLALSLATTKKKTTAAKQPAPAKASKRKA